jgi:hypothetical protein
MEQPNSPSLDPRLRVPRRQPEPELVSEPYETEAALSIQTAVRGHHHRHAI